MEDRTGADTPGGLRTVSLFSGIAGLDLGLERAGHRTVAMCESWEPARRVLTTHFPDVEIAPDVKVYNPSGDYEVLAAGFPCTDISHAGTKTGIFGPNSGLVEHAFRIAKATEPEWIVLENVPHLLTLHGGAGIAYITEALELLGYRWAYRTLDTRFTGLPQRRHRVIIVASRRHHPERLLFSQDATKPAESETAAASGFYWTEGRNGLGLVTGAIPTLKGGSMLGTPSAPAIWMPGALPGRRFVIPDVEDGERLQGFERGWTKSAVVPGEPDLRWKLLGNAVPVDLGKWVGQLLASPFPNLAPTEDPLGPSDKWPPAAWGSKGRRFRANVSTWPLRLPFAPLEVFISENARPLSHRATTGFLSRLDEKARTVPADFYLDLEQHQQVTRPPMTPAPQSWASSPGARSRMRKQKQKDTKPEIALRRELYRLGIGYRLQTRPVDSLRARLDIVHNPSRTAIDVRGCFWHRCPLHGTAPKLNADRWSAKLDRNVERDHETVEALERHGWAVVVVWEHDDMTVKAAEIADLIKKRRRDRPWMSPSTTTVDL